MRIERSINAPSAVLLTIILIIASMAIFSGWNRKVILDAEPPTTTVSGYVQDIEESRPQEDDQAADEPPSQFIPPTPPAASERTDERLRMVEMQIAGARDGRALIRNKKVLEAMRAAPRHAFVPKNMRSRAYKDTPLPIGHGQTISQPYIVALMTECLELTPESKVLEIGTGSAYQAAVLSHLTPQVYTVEIIEPLAERARETLDREGYDRVHSRQGDGYFGWEEEGPFDAIIVTCAAGHLPPPLWDQLKPGGRIVIPIGGTYELQRLVLVTKLEDGSRRSRTIISVRFVPLTRAASP